MRGEEQDAYIDDLQQRVEAFRRVNSEQADILADLQRQSRGQVCECTCSRSTSAALDAQARRIEQLKAGNEARRNLFIDGLVAMA